MLLGLHLLFFLMNMLFVVIDIENFGFAYCRQGRSSPPSIDDYTLSFITHYVYLQLLSTAVSDIAASVAMVIILVFVCSLSVPRTAIFYLLQMNTGRTNVDERIWFDMILY